MKTCKKCKIEKNETEFSLEIASGEEGLNRKIGVA